MHVRTHHRYSEIWGGQTLGNVCAPYLCMLAESTDSCRDLGSRVPLKSLRGLMGFSFPQGPPCQRMEGPPPCSHTLRMPPAEAMRQVWGAPSTRLSGKEA